MRLRAALCGILVTVFVSLKNEWVNEKGKERKGTNWNGRSLHQQNVVILILIWPGQLDNVWLRWPGQIWSCAQCHTVPFNSIRQGVWPVTGLTKLWIRQVGLWPVTFKKFRQDLEILPNWLGIICTKSTVNWPSIVPKFNPLSIRSIFCTKNNSEFQKKCQKY